MKWLNTATHSYSDGRGSGYALGAVTSSSTTTSKNGGAGTTATTDTVNAWYDAAAQSTGNSATTSRPYDPSDAYGCCCGG